MELNLVEMEAGRYTARANEKVDVFVCTKPFQWLNVENIDKDNPNNILIIINSFPNAVAVSKKIKEFFPYWKGIHIVKNRLYAFLKIREFNVRHLYIDSDYGRKSYLYSFIPARQFVYDEGIGTYAVYLKEKRGFANKIKYNFFKLIGAGVFQGGNWKTEGVIVYNMNYYKMRFGPLIKNKTVLMFKEPLEVFVKNNSEKLLEVFDFDGFPDITGKRILLYLTFHSLRQEIIDYINKNRERYDLIMIKPHPHLLRFGDISQISNKGFTIVNNPIMAEVLILKLAKLNSVTVLHESSSTCINLSTAENVRLVDFENPLYSKDYSAYITALV